MLKLAFKEEVRLGAWNLRPESTAILDALLATAPPMFDNIVLVTSACDGKRDKPSCHELGRAYDVRYLPGEAGPRPGCIVAETDAEREELALLWCDRLRLVLGKGYQVVRHGRHIHIERDAR